MFFGLLISAHLGFAKSYNDIHPHIGVYLNKDFFVGAYYNSEERISAYIAYKLDIFKQLNLELGVVTGYDSYEVVPMLKLNYNNIFIAPATESVNGKTNLGLVVGLEWRH
jgi:hypothetical protein